MLWSHACPSQHVLRLKPQLSDLSIGLSIAKCVSVGVWGVGAEFMNYFKLTKSYESVCLFRGLLGLAGQLSFEYKKVESKNKKLKSFRLEDTLNIVAISFRFHRSVKAIDYLK